MIKQEEENGIPAKVISSVFLGVNLHYFIALEDGTQLEVISPSDLGEILPDGTAIKLQVVEEKINIFDKDTKATLIRKEV
jgi:iron(III) transport system ATP-binding protein